MALSSFAGRITYVTYFVLIGLFRKPGCLEVLNVWHCLERQEVVLCFVLSVAVLDLGWGAVTYTVIPQLTKIIRSGITFISRNVISHRFL